MTVAGPSGGSFEWSQTVSAVGVTPSSRVSLDLAPVTDSAENSPEMLNVTALSASPGTDQITVTITFSTLTRGPIDLLWSAN